MKRILLYLTLFIMLSCQDKTDKSFEGDGKVDFVSVNKIPVVEGKINGKKAFFIVDSGASLSVLDENQKNYYSFDTQESNIEAAGYSGVAVFREVVGADIEIGGIRFVTDFKSQDMSKIVSIIRSTEGVSISGIIGSDIMKTNNFIINYTDNSLTLGK